MILNKFVRRSTPLARGFSNAPKQPIEYKVDEKAFEAQMKTAQDSIAAKLKAIKAQQQSEIKDGEHHVHNPKDFGFISATNKMKDVHGHIYYYNNVNFYREFEGALIYKTEPQMHKATAFVDAGLSGLVIYASTKVCRNIYLLANGMPWHPLATLGWAFLGLIQSRYLMDEYLRQVFFVDEIQIVGPNMDKVRVTTLLKGSFNVFAFARMNFFERNIAREYVFEMKDCGLSEIDSPNSPIIRLQMGEKKFYAFRNRTMMIN